MGKIAGIDFANHGVFGMLGYNIGTAKKRINFVLIFESEKLLVTIISKNLLTLKTANG